MRKEDEYYDPVVYKYDNATVKVYRPILTEEERERRMERIKAAAVRLVMSVESRKNHSDEEKNDKMT